MIFQATNSTSPVTTQFGWSSYEPSFNMCISILLIALLGYIFRILRIIPLKFVPVAIAVLNKYIFFIALPATVIKTLAVQNFKVFAPVMWNTINAFLIFVSLKIFEIFYFF